MGLLGLMLLIIVVVWAIKEIAEGTGISDRVRYGKQTRSGDKEE